MRGFIDPKFVPVAMTIMPNKEVIENLHPYEKKKAFFFENSSINFIK